MHVTAVVLGKCGKITTYIKMIESKTKNVRKLPICDKLNRPHFTRSHLSLDVVDYPTPSEEWGHGGRPWSPKSRAITQGLDLRS